jgi:sulfoxide reductase heme-binding subunit YedZ
VVYESVDLPFAVAWAAFFIFFLLAITSNNLSVRKLGKAWKPLHRLTYLGAIFSFWHWLLFAFFPQTALTWLGILVATKAVHLGVNLRQKKSRSHFIYK